MDDSVQTYPLNAERLVKGDTISADVIAEFFGQPINSQNYKLRLLGLIQKISRILEDRGKPATVIRTGRSDPIGPGGIRVLTDDESPFYEARQYRHGMRKSARSHKRLLQADISQMSPETRKVFEREIVVQGAIQASIVSTRAKVAYKAVTRNAPPMISGPEE